MGNQTRENGNADSYRADSESDIAPQAVDLKLEDGSHFAVGGVRSTLSTLVGADRILDDSRVFSIGAPDGSRMASQKPGEEKYHIDTEVARGGIGAILRARDDDLRRTIAMKVMLSGLRAPPVEYERFVKEVQVTGFLEHPNIVPIHELTQE